MLKLFRKYYTAISANEVLLAQIAFWRKRFESAEAENSRLELELKRERERNRRREDALLQLILKNNNHFTPELAPRATEESEQEDKTDLQAANQKQGLSPEDEQILRQRAQEICDQKLANDGIQYDFEIVLETLRRNADEYLSN